MGKRLRAGRPESIDTLILVPHQEQVAVFPGQQPQDHMLNFGGVLGFVHAQVLPARPQPGQQIRAAPQDAQGIDHLVVVVHPLMLPHGLAIGAVEGREIAALYLQLIQFPVGKHLVFGIGDGGGQALDGAFGGKLPALGPEQFGQQGAFAVFFQQRKGGAAVFLLIQPDDPAAHPVDGAELQPGSFFGAEERGVPLPHIPRRRHGIGHGKDRSGGDAAHMEQIAQAADQHGGLAAAGHRQQQYRAVHRLHRGLLLRIQAQCIAGFELGKIRDIL